MERAVVSQALALAITYVRSVTVSSRSEVFAASPGPSIEPMVLVLLAVSGTALVVGWQRAARWATALGIGCASLALIWVAGIRSTFVAGPGNLWFDQKIAVVEGLAGSDVQLGVASILLALGLYAKSLAKEPRTPQESRSHRVSRVLAVSPLLLCSFGCLFSSAMFFRSGFYHWSPLLDRFCYGIVEYLRGIDVLMVLLIGWSILCLVGVYRRLSRRDSGKPWLLAACVAGATAATLALRGHSDREYKCWEHPFFPASEWQGADFTGQHVSGPQTCYEGDGLLMTLGAMAYTREVSFDRSGGFVFPPTACADESSDTRVCVAFVHGDSRAPGDKVAERARELQQLGYSLILVAQVVDFNYEVHLGWKKWPRRCIVGWMTTDVFTKALPRYESWVKFLRSRDFESDELPLQLAFK